MYITCPECGTRYIVKADAIGAEGRKVKCAKCGHKWHQTPANEEERESIANAIETLSESVQKEEVSQNHPLPVITEKNSPMVPTWLKAAVFIFVIFDMIVGAIFYKEDVMLFFPQTKPWYQQAMLSEEDAGVMMYDVNVLDDVWNEKMTKWVSGTLVNRSNKELAVPKVRISMLDQERRKIGERYFPTHNTVLSINEELPFRAPLPNLPKKTAYLVVDMGNSLHMMLH